jgi:hypothetical protein
VRTPSLLLGALLLALTATSCSTGPAPPRPGTPAFYWNAAKDAYRTGDYQKTDTDLAEIVRTDNEFAARARAWSMVISAGLAQGFSQLADSFEAGARANRANPMPFRKQVTTLRSFASAADMQMAQTAHTFLEKDKDPNVLLAFEYPSGSAAEPGSLKKVAGGILIQDSERDSLQAAMLQRGVLLSLCRLSGNPDDAAKTLEKFKAAEVRVPRDVFLFAVAKTLQEHLELFGSSKLDQPTRLKALSQEALEALHSIPETKETKALAAKIQSSLKKTKGT